MMAAQLQTESKIPIGKAFTPFPTGLLQRKCACGTHTMAGGECAKKKSPLQRKLTIGASNDPLELEANRVADQVMSMSLTSKVNPTPPRIQRFSGQANNESLETAPPSVDRVLSSPGTPLEPSLRQDMEVRFGHNFSQVRVHTDSAAEQSAREVNANAYTVDNNLVFGAGQFSPHTQSGKRLLAHELTHVAQQNAVRVSDGRAGIAGALLSADVDRVAHTPILQRDDSVGIKKEEVLNPRIPYREKAPSTTGETVPEEGEAEKGPALVLASAARPMCNPIGFLRKDYLAQPNTNTDDFGLTRFAGTVSTALTTQKVKGGVMLEPLQVRLPTITSVFTTSDTFIEGTAKVFGQEGAECRGGEVPLQWRIFALGAAKIREGEIEHCEDLQYAYDVTFGWYAQVVDGLIAKKRKFASEAVAFKRLQRLTGTHPNGWSSVFECLAKKTENRDGRKFTSGWHTPQVKPREPRLEDGCKFSRIFVTGASNFPELGKHPTPDVIRGCGESPEAVKTMAAKVAAKTSADDKSREGKSSESPPKTPEPIPKSTEP